MKLNKNNHTDIAFNFYKIFITWLCLLRRHEKQGKWSSSGYFVYILERQNCMDILANKPAMVDCWVPEFLSCLFSKLSFNIIPSNEQKKFFSVGVPSI